MNCQNCGAPMKFDHEKLVFSCDYCTSVYFPQETLDGIRVTDEESSLSCPICRIPLVHAYASEIKVLSCSKCRGILIEQPNFLFVIEHLRRSYAGDQVEPPPVRLEELQRKINCPQCRQQMDTHPYGGPGNIVIDNCPRCLLNWLDANELHRIVRAPDRSTRPWDVEADPDRLFSPKKKSPR